MKRFEAKYNDLMQATQWESFKQKAISMLNFSLAMFLPRLDTHQWFVF